MNEPTTPPKDAIRFLKTLDPKAKFFTFQTFDDNKKRKDPKLARILHGTLAQHHPTLAKLNAKGAGIYATINETDGKGREADNIVRVRAVFVDLDGAPIGPVQRHKRKPHMVVETSPGRFAGYWLTKDVELDQFRPIQKGLIETFDSDKGVHDLPRVMRLPGYLHRKGKPFKSRIMSINTHKPYLANAFDDIAEDDGPHLSSDPTGDSERIARALKVIPNDDLAWEAWNRIALATYAASGGSEEGFDAFDAWSEKSKTKYDPEATRQRWDEITKCPPKDIGMGTLVKLAREANPKWDKKLTIDDYYAHLPDHRYICAPAGGGTWPASSINAILPKQPGLKGNRIDPSLWLDRNRAVHSLTWAPGKPPLIPDTIFDEGGWREHPGMASFNRFRPADMKLGDPKKAQRWVDHVKRVYPNHWEGILDRFAHIVQKPGIKINHAIVLGGPTGVGKDMILAPLREAVGPWNFKSIPPWALFSNETPFVASIVLNINEADNLQGEASPRQFYEQMKQYAAAPPLTLLCNIKYVPRHFVPNVCNVVMTLNERSGLFLPAEDRRNWVLWTEATSKDLGGDPYYKAMWEWLEKEGYGHVAAYLHQRDISHFNPKAEPVKTQAFMTMVAAHMSNEDSEMDSALSQLENPDALTTDCLATTSKEMEHWLKSTSPRIVGAMLRRHDYAPVRNPGDTTKGMWTLVGGDKPQKVVIYAKINQVEKHRLAAATVLKATLEKERKRAKLSVVSSS